MFFILSKTLYFLIMPYTLIGLALLGALLFKKEKIRRIFLWGAIILFFIFGNNFLANQALKAWELDAIPYKDITHKYEYGVVLTGLLDNLQKPNDRPHFQKGADRLFHTYQLYRKDLINKILISGGSGALTGPEFSEGENLKNIFIYLGVPEEDILTEGKSRNTAESAKMASALLKERNATNDFILITSAFHMRRARDSFQQQLNLPVPVFPVDYYSDPRITFEDYWLPTFEGLHKWSRLIHEVTGYIVYDVVGYL